MREVENEVIANNWRRAVFGALLLSGSMLARGQEVPYDDQKMPEPRLRLETLPTTGADYTVMLPAALDGNTPLPLIVALHFGGYAGPHYGRIIAEQLVAPAYTELGAIVVAPDCVQGSWRDASCEATVLGVVEHVRQQFPIDRRRIVLTGYSMGGVGTWELSARHSHIFSAAVVMAGRPRDELAVLDWTLPLYVIHARNDELMPVAETENFVATIRAAGAEVTLDILDGVSHFETHRFIEPLRATVPWLLRVWAE